MLLKYHSLSIALAGLKVLIVDGKCYTCDCFPSAPVFIKTTMNGRVEYRYGEHCLSDAPTLVAYRSLLTAVDYKYFNSFMHEDTKVIIFSPNKTQNNVS